MDDNGKEYWSSRDLCNAMGYSGYWKFQNVIDKAIKVASEKGMDIDDHFNHVVEMVKLGSESFRKVEAFHLSRMACMSISENADSRKLLVKQARAYFSQSVSTTELMQNSLESNVLRFHFMKKSICIKSGHIGSSWSKRLRKWRRRLNASMWTIKNTHILQKSSTAVRHLQLVINDYCQNCR